MQKQRDRERNIKVWRGKGRENPSTSKRRMAENKKERENEGLKSERAMETNKLSE